MSDHYHRINRALNYIEDHLFEDLPLEAVARCAAMSPYHFHRVFAAITGSTVGRYVRELRLADSLKDLRKPECRIIELALRCGFESQEAFTRAFKGQFDVTPGRFRKLAEEDVARATEGHVERPEIVRKNGFRVVGLAAAFTGMNFAAVYSLWREYSEKSAAYFDEPDADALGVVLPAHPDVPTREDEYVYVAGHAPSTPSATPTGFVEVVVPPATYARFVHRGHVATLQATIRKAWRSWLWHARLEPAGGPQLEVYPAGRFVLGANDSEVDLYIPIEDGEGA